MMLEDSASRNASSMRLPQLPQEILDMIILSSFNIPLLHDPEVLDYTPIVRDIFTSPFFRVSRACRQSAIDRLADSFVWIEIVSYETETFPFTDHNFRLAFESLCQRIPVLDECDLSLLPARRTSVSFELNKNLATAVGDTESTLTIREYVFPYQYESLLRFMVEWRRLWPNTFLSIHADYTSYATNDFVGRMVSQAKGLVQFLRFGSVFDATWGLGRNYVESSVASALMDCQSVLAHMKRLDASGMMHEADIFAHHYLPTLHSHVSSVLSGERAALLENLTQPDWMDKQESKHFVLIQQQYMLCRLVATRALQRMWTIPSLRQKWLESKRMGAPRGHWRPPLTQEPGPLGLFGLPDRWMAAWYYHTGLACADGALAAQDSVDPEMLGPVIKLGIRRPRLTRRLAIKVAIEYLWCAKELDPSEGHYEYSHKKLEALVEHRYEFMLPSSPGSGLRHEYTDIDGIQRHWIGRRTPMSWMERSEALPLLPRAQSLAVQDLRKLNEMMASQVAKGVGYVESSLREA